jgi:hypothetical protein
VHRKWHYVLCLYVTAVSGRVYTSLTQTREECVTLCLGHGHNLTRQHDLIICLRCDRPQMQSILTRKSCPCGFCALAGFCRPVTWLSAPARLIPGASSCNPWFLSCIPCHWTVPIPASVSEPTLLGYRFVAWDHSVLRALLNTTREVYGSLPTLGFLLGSLHASPPLTQTFQQWPSLIIRPLSSFPPPPFPSPALLFRCCLAPHTHSFLLNSS